MKSIKGYRSTYTGKAKLIASGGLLSSWGAVLSCLEHSRQGGLSTDRSARSCWFYKMQNKPHLDTEVPDLGNGYHLLKNVLIGLKMPFLKRLMPSWECSITGFHDWVHCWLPFLLLFFCVSIVLLLLSYCSSIVFLRSSFVLKRRMNEG
jgi:hypothetical protein